MKKKIGICLLTGVLLTSIQAGTTAQATEIPSVSVENMNASLYEGVWYPIVEAGVQIYLPENFLELVEEEDPENGILYIFQDPEQEGFTLKVTYESAKDMGKNADAESFIQTISQKEGFSAISEVLVNGYDCVTYDLSLEQETGTALAFFGEQGGEYIITAAPYDTNTGEMVANIFFSLSEIETE